jgi:uncharacterized protein YjbI with pentapeptide repeats
MRDRRGRGRWSGPIGRPLVLAGVAALLLVACVFVLPPLLVPITRSATPGIAPLDRMRLEHERVKLRNEARATLLQAFGGAFFLVTAVMTWRQIQVMREGQITDRFTRAIDHLGTEDKLEVRLGGIYALERIANDFSKEQDAIFELLAAFVRRHAGRSVATVSGADGGAPAEVLPLRIRAPDVQAVMTILGRRHSSGDDGVELHLAGVDLRRATLPDASLRAVCLESADLSGIDLQRADLRQADLRGADLRGANLAGARLTGACLQDANLWDADLTEADLEGAEVERANLRSVRLVRSKLDRAVLRDVNLGEARLQEATLREARLERANLWEAKLHGVDLRDADLKGSTLVRAALAGAMLEGSTLVGATLDGAVLTGASADAATAWPDGFDPASAGVRVDRRSAGAGRRSAGS